MPRYAGTTASSRLRVVLVDQTKASNLNIDLNQNSIEIFDHYELYASELAKVQMSQERGYQDFIGK